MKTKTWVKIFYLHITKITSFDLSLFVVAPINLYRINLEPESARAGNEARDLKF